MAAQKSYTEARPLNTVTGLDLLKAQGKPIRMPRLGEDVNIAGCQSTYIPGDMLAFPDNGPLPENVLAYPGDVQAGQNAQWFPCV
jgi:hypothetical protein